MNTKTLFTLILSIVVSSYLFGQDIRMTPMGGGIAAPAMMGTMKVSPMSSPSFEPNKKEDRSPSVAKSVPVKEQEPIEESQGRNENNSDRDAPTKPRFYYVDYPVNDVGYILRSSEENGAVLASVERQDLNNLREDLKISPYMRDPYFVATRSTAPTAVDKVGHGYYLTPEEIEAISIDDKTDRYISSIETTEKETIVTVLLHPGNPLFWFNISRNTYIEDTKTKRRYDLVGTYDDIPIGRLIVAINCPSALRIKLRFEPLDDNVRTVNILRHIDEHQVPVTRVSLTGGYYGLSLKSYLPKNR